MSFIAEVKRRNVIKVALAYLAVSWLLIQVVTSIEAPLGLPGWFDTGIIVLLVVCLPIVLIFAWAFELTSDGIRPTESVAPRSSITRQTGQKLNRITIGVLVVAVALLVADRIRTGDDRNVVIPGSIAVLPFDNLSPDRGDSYFAPGLHEEILNQLEKIQNLTVISRTTMRQYENTHKTIGEIAEELNVEAVMEGSVRYANNVVRVTAQLIDPVTDGHLWSDTYERPFEDVFAIESEIAMNVANAMAIEFSIEEQQNIAQIPTVSSDAYALVLAASASVSRASTAGVAAALDQIDRATELDPRSAFIQARRASTYSFATAFFPERRDELLAEAESAADRAVEIDSSFGGAYISLAMVAAARGEWSVAQDYFDKTAAARIEGVEPFAAFGFVVGNTRAAFDEISVTRKRDPLNSNAWFWFIVAEDTLGSTSASLDVYEHGKALFAEWPAGHANAVTTLLGAGQIERAIEIALEYSPNPVVDLVADNIESPDSAIAALERLYLEDPTANRLSIAQFSAYFGDTGLAIQALGDTMRASPISGHYLWRPIFRDVRLQPAFKDLLREYGFVDYWRRHGWPDQCSQRGPDDFVCT